MVALLNEKSFNVVQVGAEKFGSEVVSIDVCNLFTFFGGVI
jgi:hypothetical protein